jgi:chromosome segregation ATPase
LRSDAGGAGACSRSGREVESAAWNIKAVARMEQPCKDADKMLEKFNMYKVGMQHHIRGQHELLRECRRESDLKSERIEKLDKYITSLKDTIAIEKQHFRDLAIECDAQRESNRILRDTIAVLEERVQMLREQMLREQMLQQDEMRDEGNEESVGRWVRQGLLSQWREAREARASLEKQLAHWMEQVNALQRQVQALERRVPSLRH